LKKSLFSTIFLARREAKAQGISAKIDIKKAPALHPFVLKALRPFGRRKILDALFGPVAHIEKVIDGPAQRG
jgi:hypothetical protein